MLSYLKNLIVSKICNDRQTLEEQKHTIITLSKHLSSEKKRNTRYRDLLVTYKNEIAKLNKLKTKSKTKLLKDEAAQKKLYSWAIRVKEAGKCDICESTENLTAHHLYDKHTHPTLAFIDDNGVCLCQKCHNEFHRKYTSKANCTPSMYKKFKILKDNEKTLRSLHVFQNSTDRETAR